MLSRWLCYISSVSSTLVAWAPLASAHLRGPLAFSSAPLPTRLIRLRGAGQCSIRMSAKRDTRGKGMAGILFQYKSQQANLQAFESGPPSEKKLVVLGGLSDGMLPCPYVPELGEALVAEGWSLVQANLRSSYMQWGFGSLAEDVQDLSALLDMLVDRGATTLAVCGHSTGSQIIAHMMRTAPHARVTHVILQGGVSDRESDDVEENRKRTAALTHAARVAASSACGGMELMPRNTTWAPITAQRFMDLNAEGGTDDYFSSDLDDAQLAARFGGFYAGTNVLIAYSAEDEYVPASVDKQRLLRRLCAAIKDGSQSSGGSGGAVGGGADAEAKSASVVVPLLVQEGDHALYSEAAANQFVAAVVCFLQGRPVAGALTA